MKRILKTKHKLIGFIGIILVLDLVLVGALMKPVLSLIHISEPTRPY